MAAHLRVRRRERRDHRVRRLPRVFRDRSNPMEDLDDGQFFRRYRFRPDSVLFMMQNLPDMASRTGRNSPIPPIIQLLVTLRYLATGGMHLLIGDSVNLSRETVGRIVRRTTRLLADLCPNFVKFPTGIEGEEVKTSFASIAGFPNVLGCVDGTFIRLRRPTNNEGVFVNRKGYHSLNVQVCCDHRFMIRSVVASWPGSVPDSRIFRASTLCANFENGLHNGLLLGDSGYPCRHFLMTPFLNPDSRAKVRYNNALCRTRVLVEQTFGILKRRFQILHFEMQTRPEQAAIYTVACAVLHNIGILRGDILEPDEDIDIDPPHILPGQHKDGAAMRMHIVQTFFS